MSNTIHGMEIIAQVDDYAIVKADECNKRLHGLDFGVEMYILLEEGFEIANAKVYKDEDEEDAINYLGDILGQLVDFGDYKV